jgi:hypothetical protein
MDQSMKKIPQHIVIALAALGLVFGAAAPGSAQESPYLITERKIPPEYERTHEFLEFLKPASDVASGFNASNAPRWDSVRLLSFLSSKGVASTDVNRDGKMVHYSLKAIRSAVARRKGEPFKLLAHLGHIYAQPYTQYSELRFEARGDGVLVHVADWYALTFERQAGELRLVRIDYLEQEGE